MARQRIESTRNPLIKQVIRLRERRERERSGIFLIEGLREVDRALQAGWQLERLLLAPSLVSPEGLQLASSAEAAGVPVSELEPEPFERASMRQNPDGILALALVRETVLERLELSERPLLLIVDGIEKPGNLGALLRTADGAGADALIVTGEGTDPFNPNVVRASMGSLFSCPLIVSTAQQVGDFLKARAIRVVATSPSGERDYWDADMRESLALVLGAEHAGLGELWLQGADELVRVPMSGLADSLNVATTGALVLFEALRQRRS